MAYEQHWFRQWLAMFSLPGHYLDQCWLIVNWIPGNKLSKIRIKIWLFSFVKMPLKMTYAKWCWSPSVLRWPTYRSHLVDVFLLYPVTSLWSVNVKTSREWGFTAVPHYHLVVYPGLSPVSPACVVGHIHRRSSHLCTQQISVIGLIPRIDSSWTGILTVRA